jgi:hypothetical protein
LGGTIEQRECVEKTPPPFRDDPQVKLDSSSVIARNDSDEAIISRD